MTTTYPCLKECGPYYDIGSAYCGLDEGHKGRCDPNGMPTRVARQPTVSVTETDRNHP